MAVSLQIILLKRKDILATAVAIALHGDLVTSIILCPSVLENGEKVQREGK